MRIFVLTTGRSGSTTFSRACGHFNNYTAGHESRWNTEIPRRLDYPDNHIEVDNRLCWFLGTLAVRYPDAHYVHLTRPVDEVADSYAQRWGPDPVPLLPWSVLTRLSRGIREKHPRVSMANAFGYAIYGKTSPWPSAQRVAVCRMMVEAIEANVVEFLRHRPSTKIELAKASDQFPAFAKFIGAEGDIDGAVAEFAHRHNARVKV